MKYLPIFLLCTLQWSPVFAQSFFPVPGALLEQEVALQQANECYIYFNNPSGDSLHLQWRRLEYNFTEGWDIDLCDYGACYVGTPGEGMMNTVFDTIQPYLRLIVQPDTIPGVAYLWFRVWEVGNTANFQDVYFGLHSPGITSAEHIQNGEFRVYPNPATDFIFLENARAQPLPYQIFDSRGQMVLEGSVVAHTPISLASLSTGMYYLRSGILLKKIWIQK